MSVPLGKDFTVYVIIWQELVQEGAVTSPEQKPQRMQNGQFFSSSARGAAQCLMELPSSPDIFTVLVLPTVTSTRPSGPPIDATVS